MVTTVTTNNRAHTYTHTHKNTHQMHGVLNLLETWLLMINLFAIYKHHFSHTMLRSMDGRNAYF